MADWQQIAAAARRMLINDPGFSALIGTDVGSDRTHGTDNVVGPGAYDDGWVFQGIDDAMRPQRDPMNTGTSSVTLRVREGWTTMNPHNTARFPTLRVYVMSDMTRATNDSGMILSRDAVGRCSRVAEAIIKVFHQNPMNTRHWWGQPSDFPPHGVYMHNSLLTNDLNIGDVPKYDGVVEGVLIFALSTD